MPKEKITQEDIDKEDEELITTLIDRRLSSNYNGLTTPILSKNRRADSHLTSGREASINEHLNAFKSPNGSNRQ